MVPAATQILEKTIGDSVHVLLELPVVYRPSRHVGHRYFPPRGHAVPAGHKTFVTTVIPTDGPGGGGNRTLRPSVLRILAG